MNTPPTAYLLLFRDTTPSIYTTLSAEQRQKLLEEWNHWYDSLATEGKIEHGYPLEPEIRLVSGKRGERIIDGPFAESKEAIGGFFFLAVKGLEDATEAAQRCPSLKHGMTVEVRQVAAVCHQLGRPTRRTRLNEAINA